METVNIVNLILVVVAAGGIGVMLYFKVKGNLFAAVSELIAVAETTGLPGAMKMNNVVLALHDLVPAPLKAIFTVERLEKIAQYVFDWMRKYADEYKSNECSDEAQQSEPDDKCDSTEFRQALISTIGDLASYTKEELKTKAVEYGVDIEGLKRNRDFIEAIVAVLLKSA